jgi:gamma-glutamylcyclotransferase (GGCT)/AIG2-like uncharacterized protein YtfP
MKLRCPGSRFLEVGCLKCHRLAFTWYSPGWSGGVADIVPDADHEVWGLIYEVTTNDLESLDKHEGHPDYYRRIQTAVQTVSGKTLSAWVYNVVQKKDFAPPARAYMAIIKDAAEKHRFPGKYRSYLETIETR